MNKKRIIVTIAISLLVLLLALAAFVILRNWEITVPNADRNDPTTLPTEANGTVQPSDQNPTDATMPRQDETVPPPDQDEETPPPEVVIPDPDPEKEGIQFPTEVPGHSMTIEKMDAYAGVFVEDGSNIQVENVAMLLVKNTGNEAIEYTEITVKFEKETLVFHITALLPGERLVVQEKNCKPMPADVPQAASALVVHRAQMAVASALSVTDNGDNTLTIENLTEEVIPTVRVFYKYYMAQEDLYVGGIAFTVRITQLGAKSSVKVQPSHFISANSRVVMALTYET